MNLADIVVAASRCYRTSDTAADVGDELCANPTVRKISFTGSTVVGKHLMKLSSDTMKRLSLGKCVQCNGCL